MDKTVTVYVINGRIEGHGVVELAKFFSRADADAHFGKFARARHYLDIGIVTREEPVGTQHPAHAEHIAALLKPKAAAVAPIVAAPKPAPVTTKPS